MSATQRDAILASYREGLITETDVRNLTGYHLQQLLGGRS